MLNQEPTSLRLEDPGIREIFSEESTYQAWLDVEAALAIAQSELGIIPKSAAEEINKKAQLSNLDMSAIHEGLIKTSHRLVPLIWELDKVCVNDSGGFIHWGATTQNITQTGQSILLKKCHNIFLDQLALLLDNLSNLANSTKDYYMPGRTHGQHAVPTTFGLKVSVWIDEICRHIERLKGCEQRVFVVMLGGAAGTLASLGEKGINTQDRMAEILDMTSMSMPSRSIGDHSAEYVTILGMLSSTCGKIGREIYTLMKQEFGEVEEAVSKGTVGSSTMPQKRNPRLSQDIVGGAAQVRSLVPLALEAMQTEHEADRTNFMMMKSALTDACILTGDILQRMISLFADLSVFPERMKANLDLSGGLIMSELVMLELGKIIGRQRAHDLVYEAAQNSVIDSESFLKKLSEDKEITANVTQEQLEKLLDPTEYVGMAKYYTDLNIKKATEIIKSIKK